MTRGHSDLPMRLIAVTRPSTRPGDCPLGYWIIAVLLVGFALGVWDAWWWFK